MKNNKYLKYNEKKKLDRHFTNNEIYMKYVSSLRKQYRTYFVGQMRGRIHSLIGEFLNNCDLMTKKYQFLTSCTIGLTTKQI